MDPPPNKKARKQAAKQQQKQQQQQQQPDKFLGNAALRALPNAQFATLSLIHI